MDLPTGNNMALVLGYLMPSDLPSSVICLLLLLLLILSITGNCLKNVHKQPASSWEQSTKKCPSVLKTQSILVGVGYCWKNLFTPYRSSVLCCMVHQSQVKILINNPGNSFSFLFYVAPTSNNVLWSLFVPLSTKSSSHVGPEPENGPTWSSCFWFCAGKALEEYSFAGFDS